MIRVLLADDQDLVRLGLRVLMDNEDDMTVVGDAGDGLHTVELARRLRPDVVLMDVRMPGVDGIEATRRIAADPDLAGTRIIVLTTFEIDEYVFDALRAGVGGAYAAGTVRTALLQRDGRTMVALARLSAIALVTLFTTLVTLVAGAAVSAGVAWGTGRTAHWPPVYQLATGLLAGWLVMTMWALFGAVLGHLVRGVALPIGLGLVWVMAVENLITNVLADLVSWLRPIRDLLPAANAGSLIRAVTAGVDLGRPAPGVLNLVGGTHATLTLLGYLAVSASGSVLLLRGRDLS